MKVYLAGGLDSAWRERLVAELGFEGLDPFQLSEQRAAYQFVYNDLSLITSCDLVIAYYEGGYCNTGAAAEIGWAAARAKTVLYISDEDAPNMFLVGLSKRFFPSLDAFIRWWKQREKEGRSLP